MRKATPTLDYIRKLYAPQDALLETIDAALKARNMDIHVGAEEGKILQLLIGLHGTKTIVEIGTLAGYSTLWMARVLPPEGKIFAIEKDPAHAALARDFFARSEVKDRFLLLEGDALEVLETLESKAPFDMVFIDADKLGYNDYLDWAEQHVRPGGLIVADNTLLFGSMPMKAPPEDIAPATWHAMQLFNKRLADTTKYFTIMLPTEEGLTVAVKLF